MATVRTSGRAAGSKPKSSKVDDRGDRLQRRPTPPAAARRPPSDEERRTTGHPCSRRRPYVNRTGCQPGAIVTGVPTASGSDAQSHHARFTDDSVALGYAPGDCYQPRYTARFSPRADEPDNANDGTAG